jgi:hypothetical protein
VVVLLLGWLPKWRSYVDTNAMESISSRPDSSLAADSQSASTLKYSSSQKFSVALNACRWFTNCSFHEHRHHSKRPLWDREGMSGCVIKRSPEPLSATEKRFSCWVLTLETQHETAVFDLFYIRKNEDVRA